MSNEKPLSVGATRAQIWGKRGQGFLVFRTGVIGVGNPCPYVFISFPQIPTSESYGRQGQAQPLQYGRGPEAQERLITQVESITIQKLLQGVREFSGGKRSIFIAVTIPSLLFRTIR